MFSACQLRWSGFSMKMTEIFQKCDNNGRIYRHYNRHLKCHHNGISIREQVAWYFVIEEGVESSPQHQHQQHHTHTRFLSLTVLPLVTVVMRMFRHNLYLSLEYLFTQIGVSLFRCARIYPEFDIFIGYLCWPNLK